METKSCADCVCMRRTAKRNTCTPFTSRAWRPGTFAAWQALGWGGGASRLHIDEENFGIAGSCDLYQRKQGASRG
jgi:hypothetical protein